MERWIFTVPFAFILIFGPTGVFALCSPSGYTVIYVNGIFTSQEDANSDTNALQRGFAKYSNLENVTFLNGYNQSHFGGGGDLLQSTAQAFSKSISNYDLNTVLRQIQPQVTTRKILLLGHSQGAFYTDEMYEYLIRHGVPRESIAVYNVGTPESYVAGGGGYLTSTNDKVINEVRDLENNGNLQVYLNSYYVHSESVVSSALRANVTLPKAPGWDADSHGGHAFGQVYLENAADRIVHDVVGEMGTLKAPDTGNSSDGCFVSPEATVADNVQKAIFAVSDPVTHAAASVGTDVVSGTLALARGAFGALASGADALQKTLGLGGLNGTSQVSAAAFPVGEQLQAKSVPPPTSPPPAPVPTHTGTPPSPPVGPAVARPVLPPVSATPPTASISPGFGGGGGGPATTQNQNNSSSQNQSATSVPLSIASPSDGAVIATTPVTFSGTTDAGAIVTGTFGASIASTTANASGDWSLALALSEGLNQIDVSAENGSGQSSATVSRTVTVDSIAPATTTVTIDACSASLLAGGCLIPATTVDVTWTAATDASYYGVAKNGIVEATTTALSLSVTLVSGATTTIAVVSYDAAGNAATSTPVDVAAITQPLLINEVGWAGSGSTDVGSSIDHSSQWIEIKNNSPFTLDLSHLELTRSGGPSIPLSGTLPFSPNGSFLLVGPSVTATHVLALSFTPPLATTTAEQISLIWNTSTTIDSTPPAGVCNGWCAGSYLSTIGTNVGGHSDLQTPRSMERTPGASDGTLPGSWRQNDGYFGISASTANIATFWGTAGGENSLGLPDAGVYCGLPSNLLLQGAPPGPSFGPVNNCTYLTHFLTPGVHGAQALTGLFYGGLGSSTGALSFSQTSGVPVNATSFNPQPGDNFFFAIAEYRFGSDNIQFNSFFTQSASTTLNLLPPNGNYATFPFTYQP